MGGRGLSAWFFFSGPDFFFLDRGQKHSSAFHRRWRGALVLDLALNISSLSLSECRNGGEGRHPRIFWGYFFFRAARLQSETAPEKVPCPSFPFFLKGAADRKRGRRKGATSKSVKNRQKVSKIFSTLFDIFRAGAKKVKNRQKVSKYVSTLFDNFRAAPVFRPLFGGSDFLFFKIPCFFFGDQDDRTTGSLVRTRWVQHFVSRLYFGHFLPRLLRTWV